MLFPSFTNSQSEEDKQLQEDLEMMVERLSVSISYCFILFIYFFTTTPVCQSVKHWNPKKLTFSLSLAGGEHRIVPSCIGGAAQTNTLLNHLHDLSTQAPQISAPTLWQAQRDLWGHGSWREQGKALLFCLKILKFRAYFFTINTIWKTVHISIKYKGMNSNVYSNPVSKLTKLQTSSKYRFKCQCKHKK